MDHNPYAPPTASVADAIEAAPSELPTVARVYSVRQIATAAFFGSVLAGAWLIATNFKVMGQQDLARKTIGWGIVAVIAVIGLAFVLPDKMPNYVVPLACAIGLRAWAEARFGKLLKQHKTAGGSQYSWWRVLGLVLLFVAILFTAAFLIALLLYALGIVAL